MDEWGTLDRRQAPSLMAYIGTDWVVEMRALKDPLHPGQD
jgi:hypothetical protein